MGKITFRADDALISRLEEVGDSKSEVMRRALREYLDEPVTGTTHAGGTIDDRIADRVDDIIADRLAGRLDEGHGHGPGSGPGSGSSRARPQDVHVTVALDGETRESGRPAADTRSATETRQPAETREAAETPQAAGPTAPVDSEPENEVEPEATERTCKQCGTTLTPGAVYCQNCGEKSSQRVFCECGEELRSDWAFCPTCGRRTPAADVLESP